MNLAVRRWQSAAQWLAVAALAVAAGASCEPPAHGCPPGAKCPGPPAPPSTVALSINGQHYEGQPGQLLTYRRPLHVKAGRRLHFGVRIKAPAGVRVSDVWLLVNSYPSGFGADGPSGKYKLVLHHPGAVTATQRLVGSWRASSLFHTHELDLSINYTVGNGSVDWAIAHMTVTS